MRESLAAVRQHMPVREAEGMAIGLTSTTCIRDLSAGQACWRAAVWEQGVSLQGFSCILLGVAGHCGSWQQCWHAVQLRLCCCILKWASEML